MDAVRRWKERRLWEQRARARVAHELDRANGVIELTMSGMPAQREAFLVIYERLLEPSGYRLTGVTKRPDAWCASFHRGGHR